MTINTPQGCYGHRTLNRLGSSYYSTSTKLLKASLKDEVILIVCVMSRTVRALQRLHISAGRVTMRGTSPASSPAEDGISCPTPTRHPSTAETVQKSNMKAGSFQADRFRVCTRQAVQVLWYRNFNKQAHIHRLELQFTPLKS